ncbi:WxL domain-containing protein [Enterococcus faecalis]|uniref:WxL domain-containing protein n=1 Tax=Enterococcus TaxID=1350 RepID=UPI0019D949A4|nr:WxL domain-containing protein [Enterococcus faecalis]EGO2800560.1 WxL domain-containing protein [Enterococcus faecalis]EJB2751180.1 WxL domain-containing protein [Enterococcus faecalis]MCU9781827.1 WxL domain-containing protein [Enterococcus faecalis]MCU9796516.1 WxL domain-containing protein [Enterococcus faecalis]MDT2113862.1 WxL domain-containing protein [Enterococcus faecalis]
MKRNKWQRLAAIGLCSSLLVNAFSGVTAVAETVTIESSPTAESSVKEETQASSEATTETSREEVTQETEKQETIKSAERIIENPLESTISEPKKVKPKAMATMQTPTRAFQIYFVDEKGNVTDPATIDMSAESLGYSITQVNGTNIAGTPVRRSLEITNNSSRKQFSIPGISQQYDTVSNYPCYLYGVSNLKIKIPKKYGNIDSTPSNYYKGTVFPTSAIIKYKLPSGPVTSTNVSSALRKIDSQTYYPLAQIAYGDRVYDASYYFAEIRWDSSLTVATGPIYYYLTNRRVTENFVDSTGAKITPPSGFTQDNKVVIDSDNFTYTSAKTLPDTYKAGSKTYKFKGWYKGKTKPATLKTTKTPSYDVTYDDNDDMTAVYEEVVTKTYNLPAKDVYFGYVDEAGNLLNPADFTVEAELGESTATESSVLGKVQGTNQVTSKLKKLSIPGKSYDFPVAEIKTYGTRYVDHTIPKRYKTMSISPTATYTGDKTKYPMAKEIRKNIEAPYTIVSQTDGLDSYKLTTNGIVYGNKRIYWTWDTNKTFYASGIYSGIIGRDYNLSSPDKTIYYYLENRRVTENFVNAAGAKITPPTGFTQGKKTVINSDNFTYTQEGALPYTYKINNKPYVLKGWYKGKNKPAKLNQISNDNRNISYPVSYDDQDDVTVVYDELKLGGNTVQFGFVNEQGKYVPPSSNFNVSTDVGVLTNATYTTLQTVNSITKGNYLSLTIPAYNPTGGLGQGDIYYGTLNSIVTIPKYYKTPTLTPSSNYQGTVYPTVTGVIDFHNNSTTNEYLPSRLNVTSVNGSQTNYRLSQLTWSGEETRTSFTSLYKMAYNSMSDTTMSLAEYYATGTVNYYLENRRVTENFVDTTGTKITAPTGFTQGNQIPMTSDTFKYTAAKALPASYSAGGKTYTFQGWYKGKTKPNTLTTSTTPTYNTTFDGNDDMTAVYKEEVPKASVTLTRTTAETVTSGGNVTWRATITNTSQAPLTTATIKKSTAWTTGLAAPTAMIVTPVGGTAKTVPVTATTWTNGVSLGTDIPVGKSATVQFTTKATGIAGQVLRAGITTSGNYSGISASATVRVKDNDQAIVTPTTEGFISVPTFNFGQIGIAGNTQQHGLKKAADYYGNGTRNPYLRIKKTQPNWSLTAQLSQPKSATDSLPTATRLLLGAAPVSSFSNYNQPTELKNTIGTTKVINLTANNTATNIVANQQFTGSNVYQLDFVFDNIKLEVPASQGMTGQQYQAAVTWNLVTGP